MRRSAAALSVAALVIVGGSATGCSDSPRPLTLTASEVEAPTGMDSAEPFLSSTGDTVLMSWLGRSSEGERQLLFARYADRSWDGPRVVTASERLLVNVADFPSVVPGPGGALWAHWLEREPEGFGYGVRVARSIDGGESWTGPWTPHEDGTATDHGFVSMMPLEEGFGLVWLDGRAYAPDESGAPPTMETALYFRTFGPGGAAGPETRVDPRVCDCCQTGVAMTSEGPVVAYRDRSPEEIRDIRVTRLVDGVWTEGAVVHADGWETGACPINGPAISARGDRVAVAWFTAADEEPRVHVAFSEDGARSFGRPLRVDDGFPAGRVDIALLSDGSAVVSWVERTRGAGAEVRLRRFGPRGRSLEYVSASAPFSERVMGFPRLALTGDDAIIVAWTDGTEVVPRIRVTRIGMDMDTDSDPEES